MANEELCQHNSQFAELWDQQVTPEGKERRFCTEEMFSDWRIEFENPSLDEGERLFLSPSYLSLMYSSELIFSMISVLQVSTR